MEKLKCELAQKIDFTCMAAFQIFDYRGFESMSEVEFSECLFSYIGQSFYDRNQAHLLFKRYD